MVDSAIGGKTGVDLEGKNLVGAFHQPSGVYASLDALATLPEREIRCGLGEVLKTAVLSGEELFARLERDAARVRSLELEALVPVVLGCARLKAGVVERDEREEGERALLNLGHTLGHALEALERFSGTLLHGEAVALGLVFAARLSLRLGLLERAVLERIVSLARALGLRTELGPIDARAALELMRKDKKTRAGELRFVLVRGVGACEVRPVDAALVLEELEAFGR
jgi:3-dehydroquinate synthase